MNGMQRLSKSFTLQLTILRITDADCHVKMELNFTSIIYKWHTLIGCMTIIYCIFISGI